MTPIITTILSNISKKIDTLIDNKFQSSQVTDFNTSNCLTCNGDNLSITYTAKKKKGYNYRIATCLDCGSTNKQVIMTVSSSSNPNLITLKDWKLRYFFKPHSIIEENGKISMGKDWLGESFKNHINKNNIWKKFGFKESNSWLNIWNKITTEGKKIITEQFQQNYDDGAFNAVKNSIDPVEVRFVHNFSKDTIISKAQALLFNKPTLEDVSIYLCASCQFVQINETTNSYHLKYIKAAIKSGEINAKRNNKNKK